MALGIPIRTTYFFNPYLLFMSVFSPKCRISSSVRLCWELEEPKGPKKNPEGWARYLCTVLSAGRLLLAAQVLGLVFRDWGRELCVQD